MRRDRSKRNSNDTPLAASDFFRRVEESEASDALDEPVEDAEEWTDADDAAADDADPAAQADAGWDDAEWDDAPEEFEPEDDPVDGPVRVRAAMLVAGWVLGLTGAGLAIGVALAPAALAPLMGAVASAGLTPFGLLLAGLIVGANGAILAHGERRGVIQDRTLGDLDERVRTLSERGPHRESDGEIVGADIDRMFVALHRQDEKINNLTRATKLYGKPLIEISNQVAELNNQLQDSGLSKEDVDRSVSSVIERLEIRLARLAESSDQLQESSVSPADVERSVNSVVSSLEARLASLAESTSELRESGLTAEDVERSVASVTSSLDARLASLAESNGELRDSRLTAADVERSVASAIASFDARLTSLTERLDGVVEAVRTAQSALETLNRDFNETANSSREESRRTLDAAIEQVRATVEAVSQGSSTPQGLDDLEQGIAVIQREVQGLATSIARLESRPAAAPPAATQAAAHAAPAAPPAPTSAMAGGGEGLANSIAGARPASGKNVLGAIAKLKSMRS